MNAIVKSLSLHSFKMRFVSELCRLFSELHASASGRHRLCYKQGAGLVTKRDIFKSSMTCRIYLHYSI